MRVLFVDTSAWDAIADGGDPNHNAALALRDQVAAQCRLVTTNYVLDELYTLLLMNVGYDRTLAFKGRLDALAQTGVLQVVWVSEEIANDAWLAFERFNVDKRWSFTDCVSYVIMKRLDIVEAFAFDHHFDQMGLTRRP